MPRHTVISADCHAGASYAHGGFLEYIDAPYRERARWEMERLTAEHEARSRLFAEEFMQAQDSTQAAMQGGRSGAWDPERRARELDADGIAAEVIFPDGSQNNAAPFQAAEGPGAVGADHALQSVGAWAYNRWLADFVSDSPTRRLGVIQLPAAHDVDALVAETKRAHADGLRGGILVPPLEPGLPGYHDPHYDPLWALAAERGLPVSVHGGNARAPDGPDAYGPEEPLASFFHFTESAFFDRRPLWFFIWGGVFDRHTGLKLVFAEALSHWVPQEIMRLDEMIDMWNSRQLRERIQHRPSDYWRERCAITATFISRGEAEMRHEIGVRNMMWGSDYPHPEGSWPVTRQQQVDSLHGVPENEIEAILGGNAVEFYGLDVEKLAPIAARIGPEKGTFKEAKV